MMGSTLNRSVYWLLGLPFDAVTRTEAIALIAKAIRGRERLFLSTPNLNFLIASRRDPVFRDSVLASDLSVADGMPIIWIARLLGVPIPERVAGSDIFEAMLRGQAGPVKVFLFGGNDGVAAIAAQRINERGGAVRCVGHHSPGFVSVEEMSSPAIIEAINASGADFVLVALGAAKGQAWIMRNRDKLVAPVISHLGAVINFCAGTVARAPSWMQRSGLEWLWRIRQEPKLMKRYVRDGMALCGLLVGSVLPLCVKRLFSLRGRSKGQVERRDTGRGEICFDLNGRWSTRLGDATLRELSDVAVLPEMPVSLRLDGLRGRDAHLLGFVYQLGRAFPATIGGPGLRIVDSAHAAGWYRHNRAEDLVEIESMRSAGDAVTGSGRKTAIIVLMVVALLVAAELLLQVRSHTQRGQSVFNVLLGTTRYVEDENAGIKLLRPNSKMPGSSISIETNSRGLRSPEIPLERESGSFRVAVVGASSVMGEMAASNEQTFPYMLEDELRSKYPGRRTDVINAGISGYRLADQRRMIEHVISPYQPDLIVVYSGFNDFADYCRQDATVDRGNGLPMLSLPGWVLSTNAIKRHTGFLRPPAVTQSKRSVADVDTTRYRDELDALVSTAKERDIRLLLSTNGKAYSREQPEAEQRRLGAEAMQFTPCFDLAAMLDLFDAHNEIIRDAAVRHRLPLFDLAEKLPAGRQNFVDSTHFTVEGERRVAEYLSEFLLENDLVVFLN